MAGQDWNAALISLNSLSSFITYSANIYAYHPLGVRAWLGLGYGSEEDDSCIQHGAWTQAPNTIMYLPVSLDSKLPPVHPGNPRELNTQAALAQPQVSTPFPSMVSGLPEGRPLAPLVLDRRLACCSPDHPESCSSAQESVFPY